MAEEKTGYEGLIAESSAFIGDGGVYLRSYLARPIGSGPFPSVIVIHEAFGLVGHTKEICQQFASRGYIALAPDLYTRKGAPDASNIADVMEKMRGLPDSQTIADLEGAVAFLKSLPQSNGKVGVIGFCSGGRHTLLFACNTKNIDAAVDCWGGRMVTDELSEAQPKAVIDMIDGLSCPLLGLFGEEDTSPTVEHVEQLRTGLTRGSKTHEIHIYPNAGHAFFAVYRPSYRLEAASDGWRRVYEWFGKYLAA